MLINNRLKRFRLFTVSNRLYLALRFIKNQLTYATKILKENTLLPEHTAEGTNVYLLGLVQNSQTKK